MTTLWLLLRYPVGLKFSFGDSGELDGFGVGDFLDVPMLAGKDIRGEGDLSVISTCRLVPSLWEFLLARCSGRVRRG